MDTYIRFDNNTAGNDMIYVKPYTNSYGSYT